MANNGVETRWKKGQSGNPKGRPKAVTKPLGLGESVARAGRMAMDYPTEETRGGEVVHFTRLMRWTFKLVERADAGDIGAIRTLFGYAAQWDRAQTREKAARPDTLTPWQKRKLRELEAHRSAATVPPAAPSAKSASKPEAPAAKASRHREYEPLPDYSTWLKLHPEARRPAQTLETDADNRRITGGKQAKEQAE
jgi:hypothetical protein